MQARRRSAWAATTATTTTLMVLLLATALPRASAAFSGTDASNTPFALTNYDFDFLEYEYNLALLPIERVPISIECHIDAVSLFRGGSYGVYVHWPAAVAAGCVAYSDVALALLQMPNPPSVIVFTTTNAVTPGLLDPYLPRVFGLMSTSPNSPDSPIRVDVYPIFLTLVSIADGDVLNSLAFPLQATISSNPSSDTLDVQSVGFRTFYRALLGVFGVLTAYIAMEIVLHFLHVRSWRVNAKVGMYLGNMLYCACRVVVYAFPDPWGVCGKLTPMALTGLISSGLFFLHCAVVCMLISWLNIAHREMLSKSISIWRERLARGLTYASISVSAVCTVVYPLMSLNKVLHWFALIVYACLIPLLLAIVAMYLVFGVRILGTLTRLPPTNKSQSTRLLMRISGLMLIIVVGILYTVGLFVMGPLTAYHLPFATTLLQSNLGMTALFDGPMLLLVISTCTVLRTSTGFGMSSQHRSSFSQPNRGSNHIELTPRAREGLDLANSSDLIIAELSKSAPVAAPAPIEIAVDEESDLSDWPWPAESSGSAETV